LSNALNPSIPATAEVCAAVVLSAAEELDDEDEEPQEPHPARALAETAAARTKESCFALTFFIVFLLLIWFVL